MKHLLLLLYLTLLPLFATPSVVLELEIKGAIGPASSDYLKSAMAEAVERNAKMVLVKLDTPGGLSESMREMIQDITNSPLPIIMYVSPKGARAASAGTYLLYASHIAAMAPGTNLGAATPISLMPVSNTIDSNKTSTLEKKALNDAMAYIKSLAELNDRNVSWALDAVEKSKSISAKDALSSNVIDLIADSTDELLKKLDGRVVNVEGKMMTLKTKDAVIIYYEADWKTKFLSVITNPNIAYILMLLAMYGIFFELMNPGSVFPGVLGAISGVTALYALNIIPFSYAGLLLIILGVAFMITEVFVAGFGILGVGGAISFAFGSVLLFDADTLGSSVSIPLIIAFSIVSLAFFIIVMRLFLSAQSAKVVSGAEDMVGSLAEVIAVHEEDYHVLCQGERWAATCESDLRIGQHVEVAELSGLVLNVTPIKE